MKYRRVFRRIPDGDEITLAYYTIEYTFENFDVYLEFFKAKIAIRKHLEAKYKALFKGMSFRQYLERIVHQALRVLEGKEINYTYHEGPEDFQAEIIKEVADFLKPYLSMPDILIDYFWRTNNVYADKLREFGLDQYFKCGWFRGLFYLKKGEIKFYLTFTLNEDSKQIFIDKFIDCYGSPAHYLEDPCIKKDGVTLFSCVAHEHAYFFIDNVKKEDN